MNKPKGNFIARVRYYRDLSKKIQEYLASKPEDFPRFQEEFNAIVENISLELLHFELENIKKEESKVYQLQRIFRKRYRNEFLFGELTRWTYQKPFGYAGDFHIIDKIYNNKVVTSGFDGLWDSYYLQMTACKATRRRKEKLKEKILEVIKNKFDSEIRIMNLACGPAREIKEALAECPDILSQKIVFDCYDFDLQALKYARGLLQRIPRINFFQKNAVRLALKKDITAEIPYKYDLIYSAGLFDYLDVRVATRLANNLLHLLKDGGILFIANFADKANNSSAGLMEWVTEWYLIYRNLKEFKAIFEETSLPVNNLKIFPQEDNVILYAELKKD